MIYDGIKMDPNESLEELKETEEELEEKEEELENSPNKKLLDEESAGTKAHQGLTFKQKLFSCFSPVLLQSFTLTFLAEWGDRSQITTVVQSTTDNAYGVLFGSVAGYLLFCI